MKTCRWLVGEIRDTLTIGVEPEDTEKSLDTVRLTRCDFKAVALVSVPMPSRQEAHSFPVASSQRFSLQKRAKPGSRPLLKQRELWGNLRSLRPALGAEKTKEAKEAPKNSYKTRGVSAAGRNVQKQQLSYKAEPSRGVLVARVASDNGSLRSTARA